HRLDLCVVFLAGTSFQRTCIENYFKTIVAIRQLLLRCPLTQVLCWPFDLHVFDIPLYLSYIRFSPEGIMIQHRKTDLNLLLHQDEIFSLINF
ncbi:MAG TPA: hypothetical protein VLZ03_04300, partial [Thermodesulfobacteriota bacterium]|nr:hypothetical protein [Thermodesulfobacteriota bacterium]